MTEEKLISKKELLLEIGTEEIPARFIEPALEQLKNLASDILKKNLLDFMEIQGYATPRRLVLVVEGLDEKQTDTTEEILGPAVKIAYDQEGKPTRALQGFLESKGASLENVIIKENEKGSRVAIVKTIYGRSAKEVLPEILPRIIESINFPKSMRWKTGEKFRFARPVRWIAAVFDGEPVSFSISGIKSGDKSYGHRFLSPGAFKVKDFASYRINLNNSYVILRQDLRKKKIVDEVKKIANEFDAIPALDDELLSELTFLVEYPLVESGSFDEKFLVLPQQVLITAMISHQRYIPLLNKDGKVIPYFIFISNTKSDPEGIIRQGNERVLKARLEDALFFYQEDKKRTLEERVPELKKVVYHERLGSLYDKTLRVQQLVVKIISYLNFKTEHKNLLSEIASRAAWLSKADLITEMVKEFPTLQGIMGEEYAKKIENPAVAKAIGEQYLPRFKDDKIPSTDAGVALSIADKIDNIIGIFGLNMEPTGSEDPFSLRRQALGIIRILLEKGLRGKISDLIMAGIYTFKDVLKLDNQEKISSLFLKIKNFMEARLRNYLEESFRYDLVDAVLAVQNEDYFDGFRRIQALCEISKTADFEPLTTAFKRAKRILPQGEAKEVVIPELFEYQQENDLFKAFSEIRQKAEEFLQHEHYKEFLSETAEIRPYIDKFFDTVMVIVENEELKSNRLALLRDISQFFEKFADFSKIVS